MRAFIHHLAYDFKTGIRDRSKLLMNYLFPLVFFALIGGLMSAVNPGFKDLMVPAMALFAYMCSALLSLPATLVNAREGGVFRSYRINGVPRGSILSIPVIAAVVHMAAITAIIAIAGVCLYDGAAPAHIGGFVAAALLSYAAYSGIGVLVGVAAGNTTVSILVAQLVYVPSIMLGGLMVPLSMLPEALQRIALLLPAAHGMRVFQAIGMDRAVQVPWLSVGVLAASTALSFLLAAYIFEWDSRASQPSRKAYAALLGAAPYAVAALIGSV